MGSAAEIFNVALPSLYGLVTGIYLYRFLRDDRAPSRPARTALLATIGVHILAIVLHLGETGRFPLASGGEGLRFFALCTAIVYLYLEIRIRTPAMGPFIIGLAFVFQLAASVRPTPSVALPAVLESGWFAVHAGTAILSFSAFAIATAASTLYVLLYRELHRGRPGFIFRRIPSLEALDEMSLRAVRLGLMLLTIGIATGALWAKDAWGRYWSWDPKECTSLTIWLVYVAYLWVRTRGGWSGKRVAYFAMVGFALIVFTFVFVELVFHTEHRFVAS
ncbi:MAG: cytochrome c biogenesis protein CcsA [Candidatus Krumholzibacteria bacterium]|nr:cytochrome c biogenesis protein CcsA [Candidatus Krumholzibacteria bacterium]